MRTECFGISSRAYHFILYAAISIGIVLVVAAIGKMFHPVPFFPVLDRFISVLEILFLSLLFCCRNRWETWVVAAALFASWSGYALFWYCLTLPCSCMGTVLPIPTLLTMALDLVFFAASMTSAFLLGARVSSLYLSLLAGSVLCVMGFVFGKWIYLAFVIA